MPRISQGLPQKPMRAVYNQLQRKEALECPRSSEVHINSSLNCTWNGVEQNSVVYFYTTGYSCTNYYSFVIWLIGQCTLLGWCKKDGATHIFSLDNTSFWFNQGAT
ncbi:hypothetical protein G9A89_009291 [Geosiphon pyriformis]|nr:hypothetical protein G9A89_009291 [Geosiphon pyriformis]